jgi:hypothetical protein
MSPSLSELFVSHLNKLRAGAIFDTSGKKQTISVTFLEPVAQHGSVFLGENVAPDFDDKIRTKANDVAVECCVVDLAQRESVRHDRLAQWISVTDNVGRVEEIVLAQPANGARSAIGGKHAGPEASLV